MPRYIIHAQKPDQSEVVRKVFEADSGAEARSMAEAIGLEVRAVEIDEPAPAARAGEPGPFGGRAEPRRQQPEQEVWSGSPSQWLNFWWYVLCLLVIPIPWAIWRYLSVRASIYSLSSQRIRVQTGVLNQHIDEIELYRVKDTELSRSLIQRVLGLGTVSIVSSDETMPRLDIPSISSPERVREDIREHVEAVRRARGVRELDVS